MIGTIQDVGTLFGKAKGVEWWMESLGKSQGQNPRVELNPNILVRDAIIMVILMEEAVWEWAIPKAHESQRQHRQRKVKMALQYCGFSASSRALFKCYNYNAMGLFSHSEGDASFSFMKHYTLFIFSCFPLGDVYFSAEWKPASDQYFLCQAIATSLVYWQ